MIRMNLILGLALLVAVAAEARAFGPTQSKQPTQQLLTISETGSWTLIAQHSKPVFQEVAYAYTVNVPVTEEQTVVVNGKEEARTVTRNVPETRTGTRMVCKHVCETSYRPVDQQTLHAFETDGKPIKLADVAKRCGKEALVVVSANDGMIPSYYAEVYKPGTIILAMPWEHSPVPHIQPQAHPVTVEAIPAPAPPVATPAPNIKSTPPAVQAVPVEPAETAPNAKLPTSPAPELVFISREGSDLLKVRQYEETPVVKELTVLGNDSSIAPETLMKSLQVQRSSVTTSIPWAAVRLSYPSEGPVSLDRIKEKLGKGEATAAMSIDGKLVDDFWLQNLKPSVLVIRGAKLPPNMPKMGYGAMPMPAVAPGPPPVPATNDPPPPAT